MNSISELLTNEYADQGVQDLKFFYDSCFFNLKVKNGGEYHNVIMIEKIDFDYSLNTLDSIKKALFINFGDTGTSVPHGTNGNGFIDYSLDSKNKKVFVIGTKTMTNGNTVPIIYLYDINKHTTKAVFPKSADITLFNSIDNYTFDSLSPPIIKTVGNILHMVFQSSDLSQTYINKLSFKLLKEDVEFLDYKIYNYTSEVPLKLISVDESHIHFQRGEYFGTFSLLNGPVEEISLLSFGGFEMIFGLNDNSVVNSY